MDKISHRPIATVLKPCPFCGGRACLIQESFQLAFGVQCSTCGAHVPEIYQTEEEAIAAWCQRRGTCAAAGGRATKGKSSWRKRRACRKNLRAARRKKKLKQLRTQCDVVVSW